MWLMCSISTLALDLLLYAPPPFSPTPTWKCSALMEAPSLSV